MATLAKRFKMKHAAATAYLGLGSNLGNKARNIREALRRLPCPGLQITRCSRLYLTEPVDDTGPEWYINAVAELSVTLSAEAFLQHCQQVEGFLGRQKVSGSRSREIDLDILLLGDLIIHQGHLDIPHRLLHQRRFVLEPLAELAPDLIHPTAGLPIAHLLTQCQDPSRVMVIG